MRGRWAAGIVPRNFCWIIKDHLAVSERPGGYAPNHRKVRRQEELLWLRAQGFTRVVSLLGSTHNLHAYEELGLEWSRFPLPAASETPNILAEMYPSVHTWLHNGERLLLHQEELGDCVMGVVAGYLLWSEILPDGPRAITAMEQLLRRQMGTVGRMIVAAVEEVPPVETSSKALAGPPETVAEGEVLVEGALDESYVSAEGEEEAAVPGGPALGEAEGEYGAATNPDAEPPESGAGVEGADATEQAPLETEAEAKPDPVPDLVSAPVRSEGDDGSAPLTWDPEGAEAANPEHPVPAAKDSEPREAAFPVVEGEGLPAGPS